MKYGFIENKSLERSFFKQKFHKFYKLSSDRLHKNSFQFLLQFHRLKSALLITVL